MTLEYRRHSDGIRSDGIPRRRQALYAEEEGLNEGKEGKAIMEWALLAVALLIFGQLFRVNALLRGIYLILEKQNRPPTENSDRWVADLDKDLGEQYPGYKSALVYAVSGLVALGLLLWLVWRFLIKGLGF